MSNSLSLEKLNPSQLSRKVLEKHKRMLDNYQREFEIRNKISVFNEKRDLLDHWIKSAEDGESNGQHKYEGDRKMVKHEISSLVSELKDISLHEVGDETKNDARKRYSFLEERIKNHKEAIDYWNSRIKELSKKKKGKEKSEVKKRKAKKR